MVNVSTSALSFKSSGTPHTFLSVADVRHRTGPPYLRGRPRQETHPIPLILSALYRPTDRQQGQKGLLQQIVCDYVFWPLVGRASPHDLFRRAGTLALPREITHWPTRATEVGRTPTDLCRVDMMIRCQVAVSAEDMPPGASFEGAESQSPGSRPPRVLRFSLCGLPAGAQIRILRSPQVLNPVSSHRSIFLLGRRTGQRRRARVPKTRSCAFWEPDPSVEPSGYTAAGAWLRPGPALPCWKPQSEKRILSCAQACRRSHPKRLIRFSRTRRNHGQRPGMRSLDRCHLASWAGRIAQEQDDAGTTATSPTPLNRAGAMLTLA